MVKNPQRKEHVTPRENIPNLGPVEISHNPQMKGGLTAYGEQRLGARAPESISVDGKIAAESSKDGSAHPEQKGAQTMTRETRQAIAMEFQAIPEIAIGAALLVRVAVLLSVLLMLCFFLLRKGGTL